MKAHVIGVSRINGVSKKSGSLKDYDMGKLFCLQPIQPAGKEDQKEGTRYSRTGYGFEVMEVDLDAGSLVQFSKIQFPAVLDLEMEQRPMFGKLATICIGLTQQKVAA